MPLATGVKVGPYEILSLLGAGGMGEVYRANDANLGRQVAIKVLPDAFAQDPDRVARLEREAKSLAALNHPNIATIHGLEKADPSVGSGQAVFRALVMELVEGPTLADRLAHGPIPLDEALPIAKQIAEALEAAHEQGIIHRDLKPANIKVRDDGRVKVLDFGLAKLAAPEASGSGAIAGVSQSPTITTPAMMTGAGLILGTAAYMSPEQARGNPVDKRADIWAFGCVLFEMLTGKRAFNGDDVSDVLAAILRAEPEWKLLPRAIPRTLETLLRRCLHKDRRERVPDIAVARIEINDVLRGQTAADSPALPTRLPKHRWLYLTAAAVVGSVATALIVWQTTHSTPVVAPIQRLALTLPATVQYVDADGGELAISADGKRLVFPALANGKRMLYLRDLDQLDARMLPGTEGGADPFFSPDGEWIGFFDYPRTGIGLRSSGTLKKIALRGGPPITLCEANNPFGGSWAADGTIVFSTATSRGPTDSVSVFRVASTGGTPELLFPPDLKAADNIHTWPDILPAGQGILFSARTTWRGESHVVAFSRATQTLRVIIPQGSHARYVATGHIVYILANTMMAVPFDLQRLEVTGGPVPLVEGVAVHPIRGNASFVVSPTGLLVYGAGSNAVPRHETQLVWVDRNRKEEAAPVPPKTYVYPRLSPDGTRVALDVRDVGGGADIWIWDLARQTLSRLTADPGNDQYPVWTPDGKRIAFSSVAGSRPTGIYWQAADGTGAAQRLAERPVAVAPYGFSPDGARLIFRDSNAQTGDDLLAVSMSETASGTATPGITTVIKTPFLELNAELSPDGRWIAYQSDESGAFEIYVRPFPDTEGSRWVISNGGGTRPLWSRDGSELFYVVGFSPEAVRLMRVPVQTGTAFSAGKAEVLFEGQYVAEADASARGRAYDVSPDGRRFLMLKAITPPAEPSSATSLIVVVNWFDELKQRVSVR